MSDNRGLGGGKGVTDTLVELDRGYWTNYRSFYNWKQTIYQWRCEFKNTHGLATVYHKKRKALTYIHIYVHLSMVNIHHATHKVAQRHARVCGQDQLYMILCRGIKSNCHHNL